MTSEPEVGPNSGPTDGPASVPPSGRARLWRSLRTPGSRGQRIAGVLLAVLGFASVVQVRSQDQDDNFTGARQSDLIGLINSLSVATDRAEEEIASLQRTRDSLRVDAQASDTAVAVARAQLETLGILAGQVPATGPGIRVTIEGNAADLGTDQLLNGLEELRDAGAEAIEINDQIRVIAQTGIEDSSDGRVQVDGVRLQMPITIDAIGDPQSLATALGFDGGFTDEIEETGGVVKVQTADTIEVSSTQDLPPMRFATPSVEE